MPTRAHRSLLLLFGLLSLFAALLAAPTAAGAAPRTGTEEVDGFVIGYLPPGIGGQMSDFSTEWGEVAFASRVWERRTDDGGYRVDLKVNIMRGERLPDLGALRDFLAEYHEVDPERWDLDRFEHGRHPGLRTRGFAFWLVEPGVAVSVRLDADRFGDDELTRTALGVEPSG